MARHPRSLRDPRRLLSSRYPFAIRPSRVLGAALAVALSGCEDPAAPRIEIVLSEPTIDFRAVRGTTGTLTRSISVSNGGDGRLGPVSCPAAPAAWLTCEVRAGSAIILTANPTGLTTSPATVSVPITAPGVPADKPHGVNVNFIIDQPVLTVSAAGVNFIASDGSNTTTPPSATVTVTNTGAGTLANLGAITCAPTPANPRVTCAVNQSSGVVTFNVDPTGLGPATYIYPVTISAPNDDVSKTVTVTLAMSALPRISLSQGALVFQMLRGGAAPAPQTVTVSNGGGGSLGTVSCPANPAPWLTCAVSANTTLTFTVNPAGLTASPVGVSVPVTATGATNNPQSITVNFQLRQPILSVDSLSLAFAAVPGGTTTSPTSAKMNVTNTGEGARVDLGTITCTPPASTPVTCAVNQTIGELTFTVNPTGIIGTKVYPVVVSAANSNITRTVTVTLSAAPGIGLSPSEVNFQAIRGSTTNILKKVKVNNTGAGTLGTITCPANPAAWLTCAVVNTDTLYLTAKPSNLTTSPAEEFVVVSADGGLINPDSVRVNFTILQPVLSLSTSMVSPTVTAGGTSGPNDVTVTNTGAGTLASLGTITCTPSAARVGCTVNQNTGVVSITVNTSTAPALTPGQYVFSVSVSAPNMSNGAQTVTIVITVT